jgi:hypothetical protein
MLFDLRGRRRRTVQVTYLFLALLMGGGLVLLGVGSDAAGGLLNALSGGDGDETDTGAEIIEERIEKNRNRLAANPEDQKILFTLVRAHYDLAGTKVTDDGRPFVTRESKQELRTAAGYWERYLEATDEPSPLLASQVAEMFAPEILNQPKKAQEAAQIVAAKQETSEAYLAVVYYAALAGDTRTADLASQKAVDLAPKDQRKAVKLQAEQLKNPQAAGEATTP